MSRLNSLFGALLLFFLPAVGHAQTPVDTPPEMNVAIFLGTVTERADSKSSAQMSKELSRVFESRGIKYFYQLGVQSLRFEDSKSGVVTLPSGQKAYFDFKGKPVSIICLPYDCQSSEFQPLFMFRSIAFFIRRGFSMQAARSYCGFAPA